MNIFEEAKELVKANNKIERRASEVALDYKPISSSCDPQDYFERGYIEGQQDILKSLLEAKIITVYDLRRLEQ